MNKLSILIILTILSSNQLINAKNSASYVRYNKGQILIVPFKWTPPIRNKDWALQYLFGMLPPLQPGQISISAKQKIKIKIPYRPGQGLDNKSKRYAFKMPTAPTVDAFKNKITAKKRKLPPPSFLNKRSVMSDQNLIEQKFSSTINKSNKKDHDLSYRHQDKIINKDTPLKKPYINKSLTKKMEKRPQKSRPFSTVKSSSNFNLRDWERKNSYELADFRDQAIEGLIGEEEEEEEELLPEEKDEKINQNMVYYSGNIAREQNQLQILNNTKKKAMPSRKKRHKAKQNSHFKSQAISNETIRAKSRNKIIIIHEALELRSDIAEKFDVLDYHEKESVIKSAITATISQGVNEKFKAILVTKLNEKDDADELITVTEAEADDRDEDPQFYLSIDGITTYFTIDASALLILNSNPELVKFFQQLNKELNKLAQNQN